MDLYLQDWLNGELDRVDKLKTDLFLGEQWLTQMHAAAAKQYNSIQYCMANPRHVMQALTLPWVTQVPIIAYSLICHYTCTRIHCIVSSKFVDFKF